MNALHCDVSTRHIGLGVSEFNISLRVRRCPLGLGTMAPGSATAAVRVAEGLLS